jgi:hypothetical protein
VADNNNREAMEPANPADDCRIVCKSAVAMKLRKVLKQPIDKVQSVGTIGVTR